MQTAVAQRAPLPAGCGSDCDALQSRNSSRCGSRSWSRGKLHSRKRSRQIASRCGSTGTDPAAGDTVQPLVSFDLSPLEASTAREQRCTSPLIPADVLDETRNDLDPTALHNQRLIHDINEGETEDNLSLLQLAEMRANHQAAARDTMLDLARALDEAGKRRRELDDALQEERNATRSLRTELSALRLQLADAQRVEEDVKVRELQTKLQNITLKGSGLMCGLLLARHDATVPEPAEEDGFFARRGIARSSILHVPGMDQQESEQCLENLHLEEQKLDVNKTQNTKFEFAKHSAIVSWLFRSWRDVGREARTQRAEDILLSDLRAKHKLELEQTIARLREEHGQRLEAERNLTRGMDERLQGLRDSLAQAERALKNSDSEKNRLVEQGAEDIKRLQVSLREVQDRLAQSENLVKLKDASLLETENTMKAALDALQRALTFAETEKAKLTAQIRAQEGELRQALILARHMQDTAAKAKKAAASCISPDKLAQLIAKLEEMREKVDWLGKERDAEKMHATSLQSRLNQTGRNFELERQFLPLLRQVRGPIGMQNEAVAAKVRMSQTQSMPFLGTKSEARGAGHPLSSHLVAANGCSHTKVGNASMYRLVG